MASTVFVPGASGGGGASSTIGAAVPATASPTAVKDNAGNLAYPSLDAGGNLLVAGSLSTTPPAAATAVLSNVNASAGSVTALAANAARLGFNIYNDSTVSGNLKAGVTASATSFSLRFLPGQSISSKDLGCDNYTGRLDAIHDSATGVMRVTEFTA